MKPHRPHIGTILAVTAMLAGGFGSLPGFGGSRSAASVRHDPQRPKTEEDLDRMEAARLKRERKATRKNRRP